MALVIFMMTGSIPLSIEVDGNRKKQQQISES